MSAGFPCIDCGAQLDSLSELNAHCRAEHGLVLVGEKERFDLEQARRGNQYRRRQWEQDQLRRQGPGACVHCGAESCGHLWTRPGADAPKGERCCNQCSHEPAPGWLHTHTVWVGQLAYPVCAVTMRPGDVMYLRRDGVIEVVEMATPAEKEGERPKPTVAFHGRAVRGMELTLAGEGGPAAVNLWAGRRELDEQWIAVRSAEARGLDDSRKAVVGLEVAEREAELDRLEAEQNERDRLRREADQAARALQHETVSVLREMVQVDETLAAEEPSSEATLPKVKKSMLTKMAGYRQKRAQAVREARQRLERKRAERLARARGDELPPDVVTEEA